MLAVLVGEDDHECFDQRVAEVAIHLLLIIRINIIDIKSLFTFLYFISI